ncbi:hypothetical protein BJ742DRAFT_771272 [Cladochytrium replicatum]|nr:hypothetical protein BJ742DRAFT_771272 [Cladochytrium replicatum]
MTCDPGTLKDSPSKLAGTPQPIGWGPAPTTTSADPFPGSGWFPTPTGTSGAPTTQVSANSSTPSTPEWTHDNNVQSTMFGGAKTLPLPSFVEPWDAADQHQQQSVPPPSRGLQLHMVPEEDSASYIKSNTTAKTVSAPALVPETSTWDDTRSEDSTTSSSGTSHHGLPDSVPRMTIWVGNLPEDVTEEDLRGFFRGIQLMRVKVSGKRSDKRPCAYIDISDAENLEKALRLSGERMRGSRLKIEYDPSRLKSYGKKDSNRSMRPTDLTINTQPAVRDRSVPPRLQTSASGTGEGGNGTQSGLSIAVPAGWNIPSTGNGSGAGNHSWDSPPRRNNSSFSTGLNWDKPNDTSAPAQPSTLGWNDSTSSHNPLKSTIRSSSVGPSPGGAFGGQWPRSASNSPHPSPSWPPGMNPAASTIAAAVASANSAAAAALNVAFGNSLSTHLAAQENGSAWRGPTRHVSLDNLSLGHSPRKGWNADGGSASGSLLANQNWGTGSGGAGAAGDLGGPWNERPQYAHSPLSLLDVGSGHPSSPFQHAKLHHAMNHPSVRRSRSHMPWPTSSEWDDAASPPATPGTPGQQPATNYGGFGGKGAWGGSALPQHVAPSAKPTWGAVGAPVPERGGPPRQAWQRDLSPGLRGPARAMSVDNLNQNYHNGSSKVWGEQGTLGMSSISTAAPIHMAPTHSWGPTSERGGNGNGAPLSAGMLDSHGPVPLQHPQVYHTAGQHHPSVRRSRSHMVWPSSSLAEVDEGSSSPSTPSGYSSGFAPKPTSSTSTTMNAAVASVISSRLKANWGAIGGESGRGASSGGVSGAWLPPLPVLNRDLSRKSSAGNLSVASVGSGVGWGDGGSPMGSPKPLTPPSSTVPLSRVAGSTTGWGGVVTPPNATKGGSGTGWQAAAGIAALASLAGGAGGNGGDGWGAVDGEVGSGWAEGGYGGGVWTNEGKWRG